MTKHTPEYQDLVIFDAPTEHDRDRIEACLRACAGIPTPALKEGALRELIEAAAMARDRGDNLAHNQLCKAVAPFLAALAQFKEEG